MTDKKLSKGVSVIMPTYHQASFISMAINSLIRQTYTNWELIIIDDGCKDNTELIVNSFLEDKRIVYFKNPDNLGLGKCLNAGITNAQYDLIAYLPSDDIYFPEHLETLVQAFEHTPAAILALSGVMQANYNVMGTIEILHKRNMKDVDLQLVQVMHRKNECRWMEREECTTNDYFRMYWEKLWGLGAFVPTNQVTCQWIDHPDQRHKKIQGGLNVYRSYFNVKTPLVFQPKKNGLIDEIKLYQDFRQKQTKAEDSLKILIVGELSFNPERIYAFEEAGHDLYGLWADKMWWFHTVGPLPFGNVKEVSRENWKEEIQRIQPDIIYALLNSMVAPLASEVLKKFPKIPFIWHFKESPFYGRQIGLWNSIQFLQTKADGIIYINEDIRHFYNLCFPSGKEIEYMILDGELPKINCFKDIRKPLLSETIGGYHTVVPGRPFGLTPNHIGLLARNNVHFHFYGNSWHQLYGHFVNESRSIAPNHIHLHPDCSSEKWTEEFSQYDAGWLHFVESKNNGDYLKTNWEDLNIPARMATLAAAGLPMLQKDNSGHIVATQTICKKLGIGIYIKSIEELGTIFANKSYVQNVRDNVWQHRMEFSFDYHLPELISFFRKVIRNKKQNL